MTQLKLRWGLWLSGLKRWALLIWLVLNKWLWERKRDRVLNRLGWDAKCPGCNKWLHTDTCGVCLGDWEHGWLYACTCGTKTWLDAVHWPTPILVSFQRPGGPIEGRFGHKVLAAGEDTKTDEEETDA